MEHKLEIRQMFDESFKRKVVEEYLATGCSKMELQRKYNIRCKSGIHTWMTKLGYTDTHAGQRRKLAVLNKPSLPIQNKSQISPGDLEKRIKELERQLEDEKLRSEAYLRMIDKAEKELKIPIRKKPNTK